jgi:hypothetical protein
MVDGNSVELGVANSSSELPVGGPGAEEISVVMQGHGIEKLSPDEMEQLSEAIDEIDHDDSRPHDVSLMPYTYEFRENRRAAASIDRATPREQ